VPPEECGGLISYGPDQIDPYRRAAGYVDRIRKGEKAADLPVQRELVINLKDRQGASASRCRRWLLARADEVIGGATEMSTIGTCHADGGK
jgi:putative ABC transport system substrate-binding protein